MACQAEALGAVRKYLLHLPKLMTLAVVIFYALLLVGVESRGGIIGSDAEMDVRKESIVSVEIGRNNMSTPEHANQVANSVTSRVVRPQLHPAELLSYLTVRLSCVRADGLVSCGTGFFYDIPHIEDKSLHIPVIVTNRHVINDVLATSITFTLADNNSLPSTDVYTVQVDNRSFPWINHPDDLVDLSVLPLASVLNYLQAQGKHPFFFALSSSYIPDDIYLKSITQTDEVIMIGYPGGLWDDANNQPIFRKGILATSPRKNFQDRSEFLIDMPVYWGSSGSPVLLFSDGMYYDRNTGAGMLAGRLKLLGINYATMISTVSGKVVPVPVPTVVEKEEGSDIGNCASGTASQRFSLEAKMGIPNNIGLVINASRLKEIEDMFSNILRSAPKTAM